MIDTRNAHKYETSYKSPFVITQLWTNGAFTLQCGGMKIRHNVHRVKPHTSNTNVEYINSKTND